MSLNKLKIIFVVNSSWGAYNFRLSLAKFLKKNNFEIIFCIPFDRKYSEKLLSLFKCYDISLNANSINPLLDIKLIFNLKKIYDIERPEIVCTFTSKANIYGALAAKYSNAKIISNITGLGSEFIKQSFVSSIMLQLYRISMKYSSLIFFQNQFDKRLFLDKKIADKSQAKLIPGSGVDIKKFKLSNKKESKKIVFLFIGRVLKDKGVNELINAIKIVNNEINKEFVEFQVLGSVTSQNSSSINLSTVKKWSSMGLINYLGESDEVISYIRKCDCIVLPSYREGMPRTILEGFAMGRPAIVSDVPGCNEIVDHGINGLICKPFSAVDLAEKIKTMFYLSEKERITLGNNARKKIEKSYNEVIVFKKYLSSIERLVNEKAL